MTNDVTTIASNAAPVISQALAELPNWHGFTAWHAAGATAVCWATHANWVRILNAFGFVQSYCDGRTKGLVPIAFKFLFGSPKPKPSPPPPPPA